MSKHDRDIIAEMLAWIISGAVIYCYYIIFINMIKWSGV